MKCKKCGSEIEEGSKFCTICGTPVEKPSNANQSSQNIVQNNSNFKQENHEKKQVKKVSYHYGFSYVRVFRITWCFISFLGVIFLLLLAFTQSVDAAVIFEMIVFATVIGLLIYWLGMFYIKRFENIAITAKMLVDIRNKLYSDDEQSKNKYK